MSATNTMNFSGLNEVLPFPGRDRNAPGVGSWELQGWRQDVKKQCL